MTYRSAAACAAAICLGAAVVLADDLLQAPSTLKPGSHIMRASGTFDVKTAPQPLADAGADGLLGRLSLDKQFQGDLEATSKGEMLAARTAVKDSAGYVAIEQITGALGGRKGTFVLQHSGTMTRGEQQLTITVVPDSGTGELAGMTGTMSIRIAEGKHFYEFSYSLK